MNDESRTQMNFGMYIKLIIFFLILTCASYSFLYTIDSLNRDTAANKEICESLLTKNICNGIIDKDSFQNIALKNLAMVFNILFVVGFTGIFLVVLSSFLSWDKVILQKIMDSIKPPGGGNLASAVLSGQGLIGISVAATMGMVAINTYQQSTSAPNNQQSIEKYYFQPLDNKLTLPSEEIAKLSVEIKKAIQSGLEIKIENELKLSQNDMMHIIGAIKSVSVKPNMTFNIETENEISPEIKRILEKHKKNLCDYLEKIYTNLEERMKINENIVMINDYKSSEKSVESIRLECSKS